MGTHVLELSTPAPKSITLPELQGLQETQCVKYRFGRLFYSPQMISELAEPLTPIYIGTSVSPALTTNLLLSGITAAAPLRVPKQAFNTSVLTCVDWPLTEIELAPQIGYARPWIVSAAKQLMDFQQWSTNWNEDSSASFSVETVDTAFELLKKTWDFANEHEISSNPRLAPIDDGSIRFEWVNGNKELFLTVMGNSIESQKWQPLEAIESEDYRIVSLDSVDHELEWLEA